MSRKEEILVECIDAVRQGRSTVADCLRRYPELSAGELKSLLELTQAIKPANVSPTPEFRRRLRSRLFEETTPGKTKVKEAGRGWFFPLWSVRAAATSLLAFVVVAGGAGSVYAAQSSLPGDV